MQLHSGCSSFPYWKGINRGLEHRKYAAIHLDPRDQIHPGIPDQTEVSEAQLWSRNVDEVLEMRQKLPSHTSIFFFHASSRQCHRTIGRYVFVATVQGELSNTSVYGRNADSLFGSCT